MRSRFLALTLIWGASFLFIKVAVQSLAPIQVAFARMLFGSLALLAFIAARRDRLPRDARLWARLAFAAALLNVVPFTLFAYAQRHVPSALASIGNATTPLWTGLFALFLLPDERPTVRRALGLVIGFCGVMVVLGAWRGLAAGPDLTGMLLILVAAACYGLGGVYLRLRLSSTEYSGLALSAAQLLVGTVELALIVPFLSKMPVSVPPRAIVAVMTLGAFGTGIAYVLHYGLVRASSATVASTVTYFIPIVATLLGVLLLGERLRWNAPAGAVVIIAGALLARSASGSASVARTRRPVAADETKSAVGSE